MNNTCRVFLLRIIIIILIIPKYFSKKPFNFSITASFSPACCHHRSRTSQGVFCQYLCLLCVLLHHEKHSPRTWRSRLLFTFSIFAYYSIGLTSVQLFSGKNARECNFKAIFQKQSLYNLTSRSLL